MIFIKDGNDLQKLFKSSLLYAVDPIRIQVPELDPQQMIKHEIRINLLKKEHHPSSFMKGVLISLALILMIYMNYPGFTLLQLLQNSPWVLTISVFFGLTFKISVIMLRRSQLNREVRQLLQQLDALEKIYQQNGIAD